MNTSTKLNKNSISFMIKRFAIFSTLSFAVMQTASAGVINWVDWTSSTGTTVQGTGTSLGTTIGITYTGVTNFVQTGAGTDFFNPSTPYTDNSIIDNRPPAAEMISITGGPNALTHTVTFSEAVVNPVMAIVSLGQPNITVTYEFINETFDILSSGTGFWGGQEPDSLFQLAPSILTGIEGHGAIQFSGTYTEISWTVPTFENWHGFTFGFEILESQVPDGNIPEPTTFALMGLGFAGLVFRRKRKAA